MRRCLLIYDSDCGPCTRFKEVIDFLDTRKNLDFMGIGEAEEIGLLDSLPDPVRHRSFHLIFPDKRLESGAQALPSLIQLLPAGRLVSRTIVSVPKGLRVLNFLYATVARLHEVGSCRMKSVDRDARFLPDNPDRMRVKGSAQLVRIA